MAGKGNKFATQTPVIGRLVRGGIGAAQEASERESFTVPVCHGRIKKGLNGLLQVAGTCINYTISASLETRSALPTWAAGLSTVTKKPAARFS